MSSPRSDASGDGPTFSVVTAAYQAAGVIGDAMRSALDQDPPPLEVVVADDGSTDDIEGALAPFGDAVRLLRLPHRGEAAAKNAAVRAAHGDFVVILDADDVFLPGRLAALARLAAARPDLDLLTTDAYLEVDGTFIGRCYTPTHTFAAEDQRVEILRRNFVFGLAAIRRSKLLDVGLFDESIRYTTDWDCWIRLVLAGARVGLVPEPLAAYRLSETAMNADRLAMFEGRIQTLTKTARREDLSAAERAALAETLAAEQLRVQRERLRVALLRGDGQARRLGWTVARSAGQPARSRLKGATAAAVPGLVGRAVRRDAQRWWIGVGDVRLPRSGRTGEPARSVSDRGAAAAPGG